MELAKVYPFDPQRIANGKGFHFIVIGAGGTGGYLIPNLARQVSIMNNIRDMHRLSIADADDVEIENLVRQNFIQPDVGRNKAEVMATRYSGAFGVEIGMVPSYIETEQQVATLMGLHKGTIPVVIGAVDNNKSRQLIYQVFLSSKHPMFWIDSGNEEYNGQVVVGYNGHQKTTYLPCVADLYPDIIDDKDTKFISEMSCAERAIHHPQCIATNIVAANVIFNMTNQLMNSHNMGPFKVGAVTFNTRTNGFNHQLLTKEYLDRRYKPPVEVAEAKAKFSRNTLDDIAKKAAEAYTAAG